jgi:8-oxo-dGTP diphosphatase
MPKRLPQKLFLKTFDYVPRVGINLLITDKKGRFLLTKRAKPPFKDSWHFPGSFILKGEKLMKCLGRIAKDELGLKLQTSRAKLLGVFENINKDPRGHVIDIVYTYQVKEKISLKPVGDTKEMKFFKKIPAEVGFNHKEVLKKLAY